MNRTTIGVLALAILVGISTSSCATNAKTDGKDAMAVQATAAIKAADTARKKAASVKGEWRDTGKMIKKAKAAAKEGKYSKAIKMAKKAEAEGHLGYEQAVAQKELRMPSYLKY